SDGLAPPVLQAEQSRAKDCTGTYFPEIGHPYHLPPTLEAVRRGTGATAGAGGWTLVNGGSAQADDPDPHRRQDGLGPVPGVELLVDRGQVVLHGLPADEEAFGDLAGGEPVGDVLEDLFLTGRQGGAVAGVGRAELGEDRRGELGGEGNVAAGCLVHGPDDI